MLIKLMFKNIMITCILLMMVVSLGLSIDIITNNNSEYIFSNIYILMGIIYSISFIWSIRLVISDILQI